MPTLTQKFILTCLERSDYKTFSAAKKEWFDEKEKTNYEFVKSYYRDHGELPSTEIFKDKYKIKDSVKGRPTYFLKELKNRYIALTLTEAIPGIMAKLGTDPAKGLEDMQKAISGLRTDTFTSNETSYSDYAAERYADYIERVRTKGVVHLSSGNEALDKMTYGYRKADLITIGGRSGVGKSWLILLLALWLEGVLNDADIEKPILFITNEMPEDEVTERIDCIKFKLPYEDFMKGELSRVERKRYESGLNRLKHKGSKIKIVYNCSTIDELNVLIDMHDPAIVFIDGSYMMEGDMGEGWEKITYVTRNLKKTAKLKSVPIINTTQLRKSTGKTSSKLSTDGQDDFAYSQSYAQDSDIAIRLYQDVDMVFNSEIGMDVVKGRRVKPNTKFIFTNNLATMELDIRLDDIVTTKASVVW